MNRPRSRGRDNRTQKPARHPGGQDVQRPYGTRDTLSTAANLIPLGLLNAMRLTHVNPSPFPSSDGSPFVPAGRLDTGKMKSKPAGHPPMGFWADAAGAPIAISASAKGATKSERVIRRTDKTSSFSWVAVAGSTRWTAALAEPLAGLLEGAAAATPAKRWQPIRNGMRRWTGVLVMACAGPRFTGHCGEQSDHATAVCGSARRCSRASVGVR